MLMLNRPMAAGLLLWTVSLGLWPGVACAAEAPPAERPVHDSPEAVFETAKAAFNERDWVTFVDCVAPSRQMELVGTMAVAMAGYADRPGADARVKRLVDRHLPAGFDPARLQAEDGDPKAARVALAERLDDPLGFFAEAMALAFIIEHGEDAEQVRVSELAELVVEEDGDAAEGRVVIAGGEGEAKSDKWSFVREQEQWFLSME
jgi:hypothetical protein